MGRLAAVLRVQSVASAPGHVSELSLRAYIL